MRILQNIEKFILDALKTLKILKMHSKPVDAYITKHREIHSQHTQKHLKFIKVMYM